MTVGWKLRSSKGSAMARISPLRMMTDVVPSPTSSSCARDSSIMLLAAGWLTSTSRRMQLPSLVMTMPPIGSNNILSIDRGPNVVRMMSATAFAAWILFTCATLPVSRCVLASERVQKGDMMIQGGKGHDGSVVGTY